MTTQKQIARVVTQYSKAMLPVLDFEIGKNPTKSETLFFGLSSKSQA